MSIVHIKKKLDHCEPDSRKTNLKFLSVFKINLGDWLCFSKIFSNQFAVLNILVYTNIAYTDGQILDRLTDKQRNKRNKSDLTRVPFRERYLRKIFMREKTVHFSSIKKTASL